MIVVTLFAFLTTILVVSGQKFPPAKLATNVKFTTDVNLTFVISARDLPAEDIIGQVDPYAKVYSNSKDKVEFEKFGTTEVVENNPNPEFNQVFWFIWKRGTEQKWSFKFRDQDSLRPNNPLGDAIIDVDQYVANREKMNVTLSLNGTLLVQKTTPLRIKLNARNIPKLDVLSGKSDPFVEVYWRRGSQGQDIKFATTSVIDNVENADWEEVIEFPNYIKGTDQWWVFKVYDHDGVSGNDDIGQALVEVDPFALKRATKNVKIGKDGQSQLGIIPVSTDPVPVPV